MNFHFGGPFLGHFYYPINLTELCLGVEKRIFEERMYFHIITYMAISLHKKPCSAAAGNTVG